MKPEHLITQQIKATAESIEQNIDYIYDAEVSYAQKKVVLSCLYVQTKQIKELTSSLFSQYRSIEESL